MRRTTSTAAVCVAAAAVVGFAPAAWAWPWPGACDDHRDNDRDGRVDYPADPGCWGAEDWSERSDELPCDDGVDNEEVGDGLADWPDDPGCEDLEAADEFTPGLPCDDGVDNDGDGLVDLADGGCRHDHIWTLSERADCEDEFDNDGDGLIDFNTWNNDGSDPGCCGSRDGCREQPECDDGIDNDEDGLVDDLDPECQCSDAGGWNWWPCRSHDSEAINLKLYAIHSMSCGLGAELALLVPLLWLAWRLRRGPSRGRGVAVLGAFLVASLLLGAARAEARTLSSVGVLWAHQVNDVLTSPAVFYDQLRDSEPMIETRRLRFVPNRWLRWPTYPLVAPIRFVWSLTSGLAYGFYAVPAEIVTYRSHEGSGRVTPLNPSPRHVWIGRSAVLPKCDWPWAEEAPRCLER